MMIYEHLIEQLDELQDDGSTTQDAVMALSADLGREPRPRAQLKMIQIFCEEIIEETDSEKAWDIIAQVNELS